jgi:hypothetical protein
MIARSTEFEQERLVSSALAVLKKGPFFYHNQLIEINRPKQAQTVSKDCFNKIGVILTTC